MERKNKPKPTSILGGQLKRHSREVSDKKVMEGNTETMISTGSTLLDLAISGNRKRGGGLPGGILLEAFGPEGAGKTVLLCEIAGAIQRQGGDILFNDPEARLNRQFASMFDLDTDTIQIEEPDTVTEVFKAINKWEPQRKSDVHGIMTDSLAALSTNMEMDNDEGDKMGMRRAKEFSEGLRKTARLLKQNNYIMACSNQIRDNADATGYGEKFSVPGGRAIAFYASVRLRMFKPEKVTVKKTVRGKEVKKVVATKVKVQVYKNSCDAPYREADIYIDFGYGIDDIRANLQYLKDFSREKTYHLDGESLGISLEKAIQQIELNEQEEQLRDAVIDVWHEVQDAFKVKRKRKERT
jgi:recombination protein RecA